MANEKLALSVAETAIELGVCEKVVRNLIKTPGFPCKRIGGKGGRILIPYDALRKWVNENCENQNGMTECPEE